MQTLQARLVPYLVNIGPDEKRALAKMGSKSVDFVSRTLTYASTNPQFKPAFVDIDSFSSDVTAFGVLRSLHQPISQVADMLDDSLAIAGSDAMNAALACSQSVKTANKLNVPGAATILRRPVDALRRTGSADAKQGADRGLSVATPARRRDRSRRRELRAGEPHDGPREGPVPGAIGWQWAISSGATGTDPLRTVGRHAASSGLTCVMHLRMPACREQSLLVVAW